MITLTSAELLDLENTVDRHTLSGVVEALAHLASEKADHIRYTWQDRATASAWDRAAKRLDSAASRIGV